MEIKKENLIKHSCIVLAFVFIVVWLIFGKSVPVICTDSSRLATIDSLANRGTFEISESQFISTCDKIRIPPKGERGIYISDKPPLLSILGAGVYSFLQLFNLDLRTDLGFVFRLLVLFLVVLPSLFIFYFLHVYFEAHKVSSIDRAWLYSAAVFGTLILPYAMVLQNHNIAATLIIGSYVYLENPMKKRRYLALSLSGLMLGLAVSMDLNAVFFALTFSVLCVWLYGRKHPSSVFLFLINAAIPVLFTWYLFWAISGNWTPFVAQAEGYFYEGSPLPRINNMGGYDDKPLPVSSYLIYFWHSFLGYRGIFSHSAVLLLGFWGMVVGVKRDKNTLPHTLAILSAVILLWAFLMFKIPITYGGANFGFRYMAIWMPLVMLFAFRVFEKYGMKAWFNLLLFISITTSALGMNSPWLIHKFNQIDLDNFDFLLVNDIEVNPYMQYQKTFDPHKVEIALLKQKLDYDNLMKLAFMFYQAQRPSEALGYLDLIEEEKVERECYKGLLFSKKGLNLSDLMKRHVDRCPKEQWADLSSKLKLEPEVK